jgi:NAD(P)-dependent dehydrogenase (short-subunit alcohol dehydrogenase family)
MTIAHRIRERHGMAAVLLSPAALYVTGAATGIDGGHLKFL